MTLALTYRRNTDVPRNHAAMFQRLLSPLFGAPLFPGSFNLWSATRLRLPDPAVRMRDAWQFWPVVIGGTVPGVAARRADQAHTRLLEVFSNVEIATTLGTIPDKPVDVRVLPGDLLELPPDA